MHVYLEDTIIITHWRAKKPSIKGIGCGLTYGAQAGQKPRGVNLMGDEIARKINLKINKNNKKVKMFEAASKV